MMRKLGEVTAWLDLVQLARGELILNQIEVILSNIDLPRTDEMWLIWEQMSEQQGEALGRWTGRAVGSWHYEDYLKLKQLEEDQAGTAPNYPPQSPDGAA